MDGIAGIIYPDVFQVNQTINRMLDCLRGGSERVSSQFVHHNIEVASSDSKLFCNEKQTIYVGLTGFLNHSARFKKELESHGVALKTPSDQEIILNAYELWGTQFFTQLAGSFSFFILDKRQDKILLVRDALGKKSLYWYQDQNHFLFSSQLRALLASGFVPQTPAPDALASYLYFGYIPQDMTAVKGVNKLLPGHYLEVHGDGSMQIESYWSYSSYFRINRHDNLNSISENLDRMLSNAVESHIPPTGDVGCFLSGGLGSSSVAFYLSKLAPHDRVKGYTVGYQGQNEEDVRAATEVAHQLHIEQSKKWITSQSLIDDFPKIAWYLDEPIADVTVTATWQLAKMASGQGTHVMSGMGSDEIFAGHSRYSMDMENGNSWMHRAQKALVPLIHVLAPALSPFSKSAAFSLLKYARTNTWHYHYLQENALFNMSLLSQAAPRLKGFDPEIFLNKFYHLSRIKSNTSSFLYFDVKTRLADLYILQMDKLTSAHDLIWYSPYLNREIIEYAASLPEPDILSEEKTAQYLKSLFNQHLPDSIINRPKRTRVNFLSDWVESGNLFPLFQKLRNGVLVEAGLISQEWLDVQLSNPYTAQQMFRYLWALLALEVWFRLFIQKPVESTPPTMSLSALLSEV